MAEDVADLVGVETRTLEPMVRVLLDDPAAVVLGEWSCRPLGSGASEGPGLYRVAGSARVGAAIHPWALVCKVCARANGRDPGGWDFPPREPLAYGSGLLAALPGGLAAPRCLAVEAQPDGTTWLWLEAVTDEHPGPWPLERYAHVAHDLGRFNGAYLVATPLPDQPWLSRGWLRDFVEPSGSIIAELDHLVGPGGPPLLRQLYPPSVISEISRLWTEREHFLTALDRLPRTFCHLDAFRRNLLFQPGPDGEELVALDWAYAGHGAIGEELAQLVVASLFFFETVGMTPRELEAVCFAGYITGVRDAGWVGDERLVRLGFAIDAALRHPLGLLRVIVPLVSESTRRTVVEDRFGRPLEEVVAVWADLWPFQIALAEEARGLLRAIGDEGVIDQPSSREPI